MLRFSSIVSLSILSLTLLSQSGDHFQWTNWGTKPNLFITQRNTIGFYFEFNSKNLPNAGAYFCNLKNLQQPWSSLCPLRILCILANNGLLSGTLTARNFPNSCAPLRTKIHCSQPTPSISLDTHSNMNHDFIQFFGRRLLPERASCITEKARWQHYSFKNFFEHISEVSTYIKGLYGAPG